MTKIFKFLRAYTFWILDLGLALWLFFVTRTMYLGIFALFYKPGGWVYSQRILLIDKLFVLLLGIGWLIFMIVTESYFRAGVVRDDLFKRFARITGPLLLITFGIDLILFWLQGGGNWLRLLILAAELGMGIALIVPTRSQLTSKPT